MGAGQSQDEIALYRAAVSGDAAKITNLLRKGVNVNESKGQHGWTALHGAAYHGSSDCVDLLLENGATINAVNDDNHTPAYVAFAANHIECANMLIEHGGVLGDDVRTLWTKALAISSAYPQGRADLAELIVAGGGSVNCRNEHGKSPLILAAEKNMQAVANVILGVRGVDVNVADNNGRTALHAACLVPRIARGGDGSRDLGVVKALIQHKANPNSVDSDGNTPLFYAAQTERADIVSYLYSLSPPPANTQNNKQWNILHVCAHYNTEPNCAQLCVDNGADVNGETEHGSHPIHVAATNGNQSLIKVFADAGADVNAVNDSGLTALHKAALSGHCDAASLLLSLGADVNVANKDGWTAAHVAAFHNHAECMHILIDFGADLSAENSLGATPLDLALSAKAHDVAHVLIDAGAHEHVNKTATLAALQSARARGDRTRITILERATSDEFVSTTGVPGTADSYASKGSSVSGKDAQLLAACRQGDARRVRALITDGADVSSQTVAGETPLFLAILHGHDDCAAALLQAGARMQHEPQSRAAESKVTGGGTFLHRAIIRGEDDRVNLLIEAYEELNLTDSAGDTALHVAAYMDNETYCTILVQRGGVNINATNHKGETPLHRAMNSPHCLRYLVLNGADVNARDVDGRTPLSYASEAADVDTMNFLLSADASVDDRDNAGKDLLMYVCTGAPDTTAAMDVAFNPLRSPRVKAAKVLIDHGHAVNGICSSNGGWPLLFAVRACNAPLVHYLVANGADLALTTARGETAHDVARRTNLAIAAVLEDAMEKAGVSVSAAPPVSSAPLTLEAMMLEWDQWKNRVVKLESENAKLRQEVRQLRKQLIKTTVKVAK